MDFSKGTAEENVPLVKMASRGANINCEKTASIIGDSQVQVCEALKEGNLQLFCDLLVEEGKVVNVNFTYEDDDHKTLLHIAVDLENFEAVRLLTRAGADVNLINSVLETAPIHVAARKGHAEILQHLLANNADPNAVTSDGKTILHILAKKCTKTADTRYTECLKIALSAKGVHVDKLEKSSLLTPLGVAVKDSKNLETVRLFAKAGADVVICWETLANTFGRATVKELLDLSHTHQLDKDVLSLDATGGRDVIDYLRRLLDEAQAKGVDNSLEFKSTLNKAFLSGAHLSYAAPGELNLMQVAANYGLEMHVNVLLSSPGIDPNLAANGTSPAILLAAKAGHHKVLQAFKDHKLKIQGGGSGVRFNVTDASDGSTVLHNILRKPIINEMLPKTAEDNEDKYAKCLKVLINDLDGRSIFAKELKEVINLRDRLENTALHYATQMWSQSVVKALLQLGANIGMKNAYGEVPIRHILPETMEDFLNETCLIAEGNVTNDNFKITARFDFLTPPTFRQSPLNSAVQLDTTRLNVMGKVEMNDWTTSGKEDVIDKYDEDLIPEMDALWYLSQSGKHQHLLKHPVIATFLWMKWMRMGSFYNKNLLFYVTYVAVLTSYIFCAYAGKAIRRDSFLTEDKCNGFSVGAPLDAKILWYISSVLLIILVWREILQLGVAPRRYFFSIGNWVSMMIIALTSFLLFYSDGSRCYVKEKRDVSALIIVLSWSEMITMIGRHPRLISYNVYVTMFYTVTWSFVRFLSCYALFIVAFGMGFYIMLHEDNLIDAPESDYPFFDKFGLSIVKTFTMFVGELEFADLPIYTPVGYLFLLTFVFLIVVVLMNLLNGLAVHDAGIIKSEAEVHSFKCQVEILAYTEAMMLGDPFNFLANWPSYLWLRRLPSCSPIGGLYKFLSVRRLLNRMTNFKKILLFAKGQVLSEDPAVTFFPNRDTFRCPSLICCSGVGGGREDDSAAPGLPRDVIELAKDVVLAHRKKMDEDFNLAERLSGLEDALNKLLERLQ